MTQKFKVLVTRKWPKPVEDKLKETFDVKLNENDVSLTQEQLKEAIDNYDALLPTVTDSISNDIISSENRRAKIIGNFGVVGHQSGLSDTLQCTHGLMCTCGRRCTHYAKV